MLDIERKFYTEAMQRAIADDTPEQRKAFRREVMEYGAYKKLLPKEPQPKKAINQDSLKWFENLAGATIEFAQALDLDLIMRVEDGLRGYICFETSFFELDDRDGPLPSTFWTCLCENADCTTITHCDDHFKIELFFDLYCETTEDDQN